MRCPPFFLISLLLSIDEVYPFLLRAPFPSLIGADVLLVIAIARLLRTAERLPLVLPEAFARGGLSLLVV